jgi:L-amino acid N-acyltransferase YncA
VNDSPRPVTLRTMRPPDWAEVARIYEEGIASGWATFETEVPSWSSWDAGHLAAHRLVAERDRSLLGWSALAPVSRRHCYAGVAEVSVYVSASARGRGVGRSLLLALIAGADAGGIWTLQAGIFAENGMSIRLHERCGFRIVGHRERIAQLAGRWRDTVLLERRSAIVEPLSSSSSHSP